MRKHSLFSAFSTLEGLEARVSLTSFSVGAVSAAVSTFNPHDQAGDHRVAADDPLPNPEPPPGPDPGDNPPVIYPITPPSLGSGPGS
jgi:hypothetical protein